MKNLAKQSLKRWVTFVCLCMLLLSPLGVAANRESERMAAEVSRITIEIEALGEMLGDAPDLTQSDRAAIAQDIAALTADIEYLVSSAQQPRTIEVRVASPTQLQVKFRDPEGSIRTLSYSYSAEAMPTTDSEIVSQAVLRTAPALGIPAITLGLKPAVVTTFSADSRFLPDPSTTVPTVGVAPTVPSAPAITSSGRSDLEQIIITGSIADYDAEVQVIWGAEPGFAASTSTYNYTFTTSLDEDAVRDRVTELESKVYERLLAELGLPFSAVINLRQKTQASIELFESAEDVEDRYSRPVAFGEGLSRYMGIYSKINQVDITAGFRNFIIEMHSDQDEKLFYRVGNESYIMPGSEGSIGYRANQFSDLVQYSIHDVVTEESVDDGSTQKEIEDYLELNELEGLAEHMGSYGITDDETAVREMVQFMLNNPAYFWTTRTSVDTSGPAAAACWDSRTEEIMGDLVEFIGEGWQFSAPIEDILTLSVPIRTYTGDNGPSGCKDVNTYFPTLP